MCCRCNRNRCGCNWNSWNNWNNRNRTDDIATRRILVTDLDALQNRSTNGCCSCGSCGCGNCCDCDDTTTAVIGTRNAASGCGDVNLFGRTNRENIDFANVFNNRCSCCD